jgi:hypothetical protein
MHCLVVTAAGRTSRVVSIAAKSSWPVQVPAGSDGSQRLSVTSYSDLNCTRTLGSVSRDYVADGAAPTTTASIQGDWRTGPTTVRLSATDARSGVARTAVQVDGGAARTYSGPIQLPQGPHTLTYASTDRVGNVERTRTTQVGSVTPAPGDLALTASGTTTAAVARGSYLLSVRIRGTGRAKLTVGGKEVWSGVPGATWTDVTAPVFIAGPATVVGAVADGVDGGRLTASGAQLTVAGNQVLDASGSPTVLRGVNRNGLDYMDHSYYGGRADAAAMANWGVGLVRIQMSENFWLSDSCTYSPTYAQAVDAEVNAVTAQGMVALLDLHTSLTTSNCAANPSQQKMADSRAITFWKQVAGRYASNPLVAFDLYNEPHDIPLDVWRNGGPVDGWQAAGMQQMYDAVRSSGATNLVFVSGLDWAYSISAELTAPLDGYGIVLAPHVYYGDRCSGVPPTLDQDWLPAAAQHPVVITEFGSPCATSTYNAAVIAYAEAHGLGWAAYLWADHANGGEYGLLNSFSDYTPDAQGQPVQAALWRAKGWTTLGGR